MRYLQKGLNSSLIKRKVWVVFTNLRQTVQLHGALHSHVPAQVGELHLD